MEFIKHLLGTCGESHLNVFSVTLIIALLGYVLFKFKTKLNK